MSDHDECKEDYDGPERRNRGTDIMDLLIDRIDMVQFNLRQHVTDCTKQQKRVVYAVMATFGWVVTHSPEVAGLIGKTIARLGGG